MPEATQPTMATSAAAAPEKKAKEKSRYGVERRTRQGQTVREALKTKVKAARTDGSPEKLKAAIKALDKAAEKKIIHKNAAARRKSRLLKAVAKAAKTPTAQAKKAKS